MDTPAMEQPVAGPSTVPMTAPSPATMPTPAESDYFYSSTRRQTRRSTAMHKSRGSVGGGRLKLKIVGAEGGSGGGQAGLAQHMQGYDRELDSDTDEPMAFEEQFILRMPKGEAADKLRGMVERRDVKPEEVWFKFKDSRRAVFNVGDTTYGAKLVDLPCIIEAQKTFDNKHIFKTADICQMLLVDDQPIRDESSVTRGAFNIEDFIYPHGLTPPLRHVRKRRFRKRLNKRTIENVEKAVERLLNEDAAADEVKYELVDDARDLSDDSDGEDGRPPAGSESIGAPTPGGESLGAPTPAADSAMDDDERREEDEDEEGSIDSDLAAEIEAGLMEGMDEDARAAARGASAAGTGDEQDDDDDDSGDGLFGDDDDDDDEEEDDDEDGPESSALAEERQRVRLLQGEVRDLEGAVARKKNEVSRAANVILKRRFEENLRKLQTELDSKKASLHAATTALEKGGTQGTSAAAAAPPLRASGSGSRSGGSAEVEPEAEVEEDPEAYAEPEPVPMQVSSSREEADLSIPLPAADTPDRSMDVDVGLQE